MMLLEYNFKSSNFLKDLAYFEQNKTVWLQLIKLLSKIYFFTYGYSFNSS